MGPDGGLTAAPADAYAIGRRYERTLGASARELGAHFTPPDVAEMLVARAFAARRRGGTPVVCDPSCGGGVFLVAAAEALWRAGLDPAAVVESHVIGADLDPGAAAASRAALSAWARSRGAGPCVPRVLHADAFGDDRLDAMGVDVVVGNPPFQSQLGAVTARDRAARERLGARYGRAALGYVDQAALFLLRALEMVTGEGVVALIQPRSFLVARDAAGVRDAALAAGAVRCVWLPAERVFDAQVDVCAVVLERGGERSAGVEVIGGRDGAVRHGVVPTAALVGAPTWSEVWATAHDVPEVGSFRTVRPTVGDVASATAGFRDQFYGFVPHLRRDRPTRAARLVTTAMIDPAACTWGRRDVRIAGDTWTEPWLDLDALASDERLARWTERLAVPKVLVATQTRVVEACADAHGDLVPMTPVIAVVPTGGVGVAHLEAALTAPAATAWALRRFGGAGMSAGALKLAARQVTEIPLPTRHGPWDDAVALLDHRSPDWHAVGRALNAAWGIDDHALVDWWADRFPRRGGGSLH